MVVANLLVERGSLRDKSQDWGLYEFLSLPSPGDRIAAHHGDTTHYLTVICVHHKPSPVGRVVEEKRTSPSADVVAKWTSAD